MTDKEIFKECALSNIHRDGIDALMSILERTDFYTAPASTKYHGSHEGGLVRHSLNVYDTLIKIVPENMFATESLGVVALFHDLCKLGYYVVSSRNTKDATGKWIQVPYYTVNDVVPFGHGEKSVFLLQDYIKLSTDESMAIRWHMCGFEPKESYQTLSKAMQDYPMICYLHSADLIATYTLDQKGE